MKPAVFLVHGIWDTAFVFGKMQNRLQQADCEVYVPSLQNNHGQRGLGDLAQQVADLMEAKFPGRTDVNLVGFSMGGIVCRYYLQELGGAERVKRFVTISSPHKGTLFGHLYPTQGAQEMGIGSKFLKQLDAGDTKLAHIEKHALWTPFDVMILPSWHSKWDVAECRSYPVAVHAWMLADDCVIADVVRTVTA